MLRLLRHDDRVHRKDDGAVRFDDLVETFKAKFDGTSQWSIEAWITWQKEEDRRRGFNTA